MGDRNQLTVWYDRLEGLIRRLPPGIRGPVLDELRPIRQVILEQRPARIALTGGGQDLTAPALLERLGAGLVTTGGSLDGWRTYRIRGRGAVEIADCRAGEVPPANADLIVEIRDASLGEIQKVLPGVLLWRLDEPSEDVAAGICTALPAEAQLEFARLIQAKEVQKTLSLGIVRSFTAICSVIGIQPIPLADMPILTTLQTLMVGMIVHISGRTFSPRLIAEFAGAAGMNFGIGLAFREGARALVKVVPVWGNAISGAVAGAGTYAIGRAAVAYFVEDAAVAEVRKIFRSSRKQKTTEPPRIEG